MLKLFRDFLYGANSADYPEKQKYFYPLKARLLRQHGTYQGWDLQVITNLCWRCEGTGEDPDPWFWGFDGDPETSCQRCGGSEIWSQYEYYLERWQLGDRVFHTPTGTKPEGAPQHTLNARVTHAPMSPKKGRTALRWLLLRYEPSTLAKLYLQSWQSKLKRKWRFHVTSRFALWQANRKIRPCSREHDDIPF